MLKRTVSLVVLAVAFGSIAPGAERRIVRPAGATPSKNWSHGILVDGTLYVSGMGGEDKDGKLPPTFEAEVKQALDNIGAVLKEAQMSPADVVSVQIYLTDGATFDRMNGVYTAFFPEPRPTRTTVVVAKLVGPGHIEITTTARK